MRIRFMCLVLFIFWTAKAASSDSTATECLDPKNIEDNVFLWESLFTKINTIVSETTELSETINELRDNKNELKETIAELAKRQEVLQFKLVNLMEDAKQDLMDLKKRQDAQELKLNNFMEQYLSNNNEWTTILRRQDGSVDFYRNWTEYQTGFGNPDGEFFIGLEKLHAMTSLGAPQELSVILKDFENEKRVAKYDLFNIGNETEKYALNELGTYSGDAGDSLITHKGMMFSTYDQDNDIIDPENCANDWEGGWWFEKCYESFLTGPYRTEPVSGVRGIGWHGWKKPTYSLKFVEMKIRSKGF